MHLMVGLEGKISRADILFLLWPWFSHEVFDMVTSFKEVSKDSWSSLSSVCFTAFFCFLSMFSV